jgi:FkbH-like protein
LGNIDSSSPLGKSHFINSINAQLIDYALAHKNVLIHDLNYLAADYGLARWHSLEHWYLYKYAFSLSAIPAYCHSVAAIIKSALGKNKKAIVVDLDNTLWGGVVGDDGVSALEIGTNSAKAEAYAAFQEYLKALKNRGVVLAVSSKNDYAIAKQAFEERNMPLKFDDFAVFKASWADKATQIAEIAHELNLTTDSFVFIDDNPAERALIQMNMPEVVTNNSDDVTQFISFIDKNMFFEPISLTREDFARQDYYKNKLLHEKSAENFVDYAEYLRSLGLVYSFEPFSEGNIERVTQLINKTNQFNITGLRLTMADVAARMNGHYLNVAGGLTDKFGDNGIITVFSGLIEQHKLTIDLWLMSCRVFKRDVEIKLFEHVLNCCKNRNITEIVGTYQPTAKNAIVATLYDDLGFKESDRCWKFMI